MKYEIYKSKSGKYVVKLERWGFLNLGWSGYTQAITEDPNDPFVVKYDTEEEARKKGEQILVNHPNDIYEKI